METVDQKSFSRFLIIWLGQFISNIGSGLTSFALGIYAYEQTHSATGYSLILLCGFLPSFILRPIGGVLTDRFDRRTMMILGDLGSVLGTIFILAMFLAGNHAIWPIYLGTICSSIFVAVQNPAYKAYVTDLLDEEAYSKASGLIQLAESSRFLISPILAGMLLEFLNINYLLIIDILTFLVAVTTLITMKTSQKQEITITEKSCFRTDLINGFRYTLSHKGIFWLLNITSLITLAIGFLQTLLGPMILAFSNSKTLGVTVSISATGMLITSFLIGIFSTINKQVRILSFSLLMAGILYALLGVTTNLIFITVTGFLFFGTLPFVNTSLDVLIRTNVENSMQGRVWSIVSLISQTGMVIAFGTAGLLADYLFNPLFETGGWLAPTIGKIIGAGPGRGIGFMFIIAGIMIVVTAIMIGKIEVIKALEKRS